MLEYSRAPRKKQPLAYVTRVLSAIAFIKFDMVDELDSEGPTSEEYPGVYI